MFEIEVKHLQDIIAEYEIIEFIDPRTVNTKPVHFIYCMKHILQNPDHWLRKELSEYLKGREYLTHKSFCETELFTEFDLLAQEILRKLCQLCIRRLQD